MYGVNSGKLTLISTDSGKLICDTINQCCQRGSTILKGYGGYMGADKEVVMCACSNKEMYQIQRAVKEVDPTSFLIILESNEVHGNGFRVLKIGDSKR